MNYRSVTISVQTSCCIYGGELKHKLNHFCRNCYSIYKRVWPVRIHTALRTPLGLKLPLLRRLHFDRPCPCARASALSPAAATLPSDLQSSTLAIDPVGTGDPTCADSCSRADRHDCVANPWAKSLSFCLALSWILACVLAASGYAKLPPTQ